MVWGSPTERRGGPKKFSFCEMLSPEFCLFSTTFRGGEDNILAPQAEIYCGQVKYRRRLQMKCCDKPPERIVFGAHRESWEPLSPLGGPTFSGAGAMGSRGYTREESAKRWPQEPCCREGFVLRPPTSIGSQSRCRVDAAY